ncbi:MAG TPA: DNA polymerase III subunit delta [Bacteroidia bacterium]|nr:DNA polymerase III subunit delta [Bacteroidia bacterium]
MAAATFDAIMRELRNKIYHPVYFLYGAENYYIDQISDYIESHVLDETEKEFNQTLLYGRDVDINTVLGTAKRFPMMADYQVVLIKEAQDIKDLFPQKRSGDSEDQNEVAVVAEKKSAKKKDDTTEPFFRYLENPVRSTVLVLCYKYKPLDKRTKAAKLIEKYAVFYESVKVYDDKLEAWLTNYCKSKKRKIEADAARLIADFIGSDLTRITNEIDKLVINLPDDKEITAADVEKFIGISKEYNPFELQNALAARDSLKVHRIVNYFAANQKSNPLIVTISTLYLFFNKIILYHTLRNKPGVKLSDELGVNPFFLKDYHAAARTFSIDAAIRAISILHEYDLRSKGVNNDGTEAGQLLREIVYKLMHPEVEIKTPQLT